MSNICTPYYDNQCAAFTNSYGAVATNVAILHPNIFYFVIDASWSSYNSLEFWNKGNTDVTVNNNPVKKTIYSPSPTGFVEPKAMSFSGFTTSNIYGVFSNGYNFYSNFNGTGITIFFAALGMRDVYSGRMGISNAGTITLYGSDGDYRTSDPTAKTTNAYYLHFYLGYVGPHDEFGRADGWATRAVLE